VTYLYKTIYRGNIGPCIHVQMGTIAWHDTNARSRAWHVYAQPSRHTQLSKTCCVTRQTELEAQRHCSKKPTKLPCRRTSLGALGAWASCSNPWWSGEARWSRKFGGDGKWEGTNRRCMGGVGARRARESGRKCIVGMARG